MTTFKELSIVAKQSKFSAVAAGSSHSGVNGGWMARPHQHGADKSFLLHKATRFQVHSDRTQPPFNRMLQVALLLLPTIVEDGSNTVHEARIAALEAKIARLTDEKTPLPNVPSAGYTRAGPGMGRVGKHAQTPDQQRRLTEEILSFADEYGSINTTMDHTWILLAGLLCWFLQVH